MPRLRTNNALPSRQTLWFGKAAVVGIACFALTYSPGFTDKSEERESLAARLKIAKTPVPTPAALAKMKLDTHQYLYQKTGRVATGRLAPNDLTWFSCAEQYSTHAKNPKTLYALIDETLAAADARYLKSKEVETRRRGLGIAVEACRCAIDQLKDRKLAVAICESYLRPHLNDADERHWKYLGKQNVLEVMADSFAEAEDAEKFMEVLVQLVENAHNQNTGDGARLRLAQVLDRAEKYPEALAVLKEIDEKAGVGGARRLIPLIEKKVKSIEEKRP